MVAKINADITNGVVITSDTSGEMELQANGVTKAKVTANGLQDANGNSITGGSYRNLIINGDMRIAQRGTSFAQNAGYTLDRMTVNNSGYSHTATITQDTDVPSGQGFSNSFKYNVTSGASVASTDYNVMIDYRMEGQHVSHLEYGTAYAKTLTLSFWIKSNVTGTVVGRIYQPTPNRQIGKAFTITSANTWEKMTWTIPGDVSGNIADDNTVELGFALFIASGSLRDSGTLQTSWANYVQADQAVGVTDFTDTTGNYINLTGFQLEVGSGASDFEFLPYDVQLARCQRYYWKMTGVQYAYVGMGFSESGFGNYYCKLPVTMRTNPTVSISNLKAFNGVSNPSITGIRATYMTPDAGVVQYYHTASAGSVYGAFIDPSTGYADFSAEL